jgi:hypothetical protein
MIKGTETSIRRVSSNIRHSSPLLASSEEIRRANLKAPNTLQTLMMIKL